MSYFPSDRMFVVATTTVVVLSIVGGFLLLGSPIKQRKIRADQQRIQNLSAIADEIHMQAMRSQDLDEPVTLPSELPNTLQTIDPISGEPYGYRPLQGTQYELCATFVTDSSTYPPRPLTTPEQKFWSHPQGEHCFQLDALKQAPYPAF